LDILEILLTHVTEINTGQALTVAAARGHIELVKVLLSKGAKVDACGRLGQTPLHRVALQYIESTQEKQTAHYARMRAMAALLLANGARVDATDANEVTPLHFAACSGNEPLSELLLQQGAKVDAREHLGLTSLWLAAYNGHNGVAELLLREGASTNEKSNDGSTPLRADFGV